MNRVFLPMVAGVKWCQTSVWHCALWRTSSSDLMAAGYPLCDWYAYPCYAGLSVVYMPYLRRYDYVVPLSMHQAAGRAIPWPDVVPQWRTGMPTQDRTPPAEAVEYNRIWRELIGDNGIIAGYRISMQPTYDGGCAGWKDTWMAANCRCVAHAYLRQRSCGTVA